MLSKETIEDIKSMSREELESALIECYEFVNTVGGTAGSSVLTGDMSLASALNSERDFCVAIMEAIASCGYEVKRK